MVLAILKRSLHSALAVLLIFSYSTTAQQQTQNAPSAKTIIAHRGASAYAPENTLPAFRLAFEMGVDFIEYDLQVTKDKQLVVLHDQTLERTTNVEELFPARVSQPSLSSAGVSRWSGRRLLSSVAIFSILRALKD